MICLSGFSASGKDSCQDELTKHGFKKVCSFSTRPIRPGETNGVQYNFVNNTEFEELLDLGEILEFRKYNTLLNGQESVWYYGTPSNISEDSVLVLDLDGVQTLKKLYPGAFSVFLSSPDSLREERCKQRNDYCPIEWKRRLDDDLSKLESYTCCDNPLRINNIDCIIDVQKEDTIEEITKKIKEKYFESRTFNK